MPNDKSNKSKLLKLKPWLTVPETARHLSNIFNEEVNEADVLRLALDGHLKLSVYFVNGAYAHYGKVVSYDDVEWYDAHNLSNFPKLLEDLQNFREKYGLNLDEPIDEKVMVIKSLNIDNERYLNLDKEVKSITGVWDLPLIGNEILDIEHKYQNLTDGPEVTMRILDGTFVQETDDIMCQILERFDDVGGKELWVDKISEIENRLCAPDIIDSEKEQLEKELEKYKKKHERYLNRVKEMEDNFYHEDNFYPAGKLPDDSVLVVRTQALMDLVNSFSSDVTETVTAELSGTERREYGILKQAQSTWKDAINATIHVIYEIMPKRKNIKRQELFDAINKEYRKVPDTTISIIWEALRDKGLTKGPGRPKNTE